jgi:hypothetical protein
MRAAKDLAKPAEIVEAGAGQQMISGVGEIEEPRAARTAVPTPTISLCISDPSRCTSLRLYETSAKNVKKQTRPYPYF